MNLFIVYSACCFAFGFPIMVITAGVAGVFNFAKDIWRNGW